MVTLEGGTKLSRPLVAGEKLHIGRGQGAHLRIPHPSLAALHCELRWDGGAKVLARSLEPGQKLEINGGAACDAGELRDGDLLQAGLFKFRVTVPAVEAPVLPSGPARAGAAVETEGALAGLPPIWCRGARVTEFKVEDGLVLGSSEEAAVRLEGGRISPRHVAIRRIEDGFEVRDTGETGSLLNGKFFETHVLTIGDFLSLGDYWLAYDGFALRQVAGATGSGIQAAGLVVRRRSGDPILADAGFDALPGEFVGILGPSGAGKTTLLRALCGLTKTDGGEVRVDGRLIGQFDDLSEVLGFVPQQEIVHLDLTARQALRFGAMLRLPSRTPPAELDRLILMLANRLGLTPHLDTRARNLSGGQLKRLSVCVELLKRPSLLFLDEPTSGLDPESETELMQQLQELTFTGCTVVATTHVMENVYLMNRVQVVMAGKDPSTGKALPGTTIFSGRPREAREFFEVPTLAKLYSRLHDKPRDEWKTRAAAAAKPATTPPVAEAVRHAPLPRRWALPILLHRQWTLLRADLRSLWLLAAQPLLIGLLVALTAVGETESATKLFLAIIATLWLGCSNAATEIVGERSIFQREKFVGLSPLQYLLAKFLGLGLVSTAQAMLLLAVLNLAGTGLDGWLAGQSLCLAGCAFAATGIGLALSSWATTSLQAVLLVPVVIIPQILFGGFVFPVQDWNDAMFPRLVSRVMPSFAAQRMMDTSLLWNQPITDYLDLEEKGLRTAYDNLSTALYPAAALFAPSAEREYTLDESKIYRLPEDAGPEETLGPETFIWSPESPPEFRLGVVYHYTRPLWLALLQLSLVTLFSFALALVPLSGKRRG